MDEYIDFKTHSEFLVKNSFNDQYSILINGTTSSILGYKPYTCEKLKRSDLEEKYNFRGVWTSQPFDTNKINGQTDRKSAPLVGVSSIWVMAANREKTYEKIDENLHKWTFIDEKLKISFIFNQMRTYLDLESIEIEDLRTGQITQSINIIYVTYFLSEEKASLFKLPTGYGCGRLLKEIESESIVKDQDNGSIAKMNIHSSSSVKVEMESK